jgi:hypothetical protein
MVPLLLTQGIVLFQDTSLVYVSALADFFGQAYGIGERDGRIVELLPLAIETAIEEGGVDSFQVAQVGARSLRVRLPAGTEPARAAIGQSVVATLGTLLRRHGVSDVDIALDERAPVACPKSGKRKAIVVEC